MKIKIIFLVFTNLLFNVKSINSLNCFDGYSVFNQVNRGNRGKLKVPNKTIYLGPGGFTMPYTLGICKFIKDNYDLSNYNFIGSSAGSWLAVYLASDISSDNIQKIIDNYSEKFESNNKNFLYKWHYTGDFLKDEYIKYINNQESITNDKHIKISVTRYKDRKLINELLDDYNNIEELLELCKYSSYIPLLTGNNLPKYNDIITIDSFFTNINFEYDILIYFGTFDRKFTMREIIGRTKIKASDYFKEGYSDALKNKNKLNNMFS